MSKIIKYLPELDGDEQVFVARLMTDMTEEQADQFAHVYRERRKDPMTVLLLTLGAFIGLAGLNRFFLGQIGMGLAYLFTAGFCLIGSIFDLVKHKSLAARFNEEVAFDVADIIRGAFPALPESEPDDH